MNKDMLRGQWTQLKKWGLLTNDDLDVIQGDTQILVGKLVERYGRSREDFEREVSEWLTDQQRFAGQESEMSRSETSTQRHPHDPLTPPNVGNHDQPMPPGTSD
jgi:uncharacterized protein YjbJ (UPF0337 family)